MNKLSREQVMSIPEMRAEGKTNEQIAEHFEVTRMTINYWVRRLRDEGHEIKRFGRGGRKAMAL